MDDVSSTSGVIASMEAISLEEMDAVKLMNRIRHQVRHYRRNGTEDIQGRGGDGLPRLRDRG